jgi:CBS domain-containing protein
MPALLRIARRPPICVAPEATVREAARAMADSKVGAVAVVEGEVLRGIFTERDVLNRVVHEGMDPDAVSVADVMTRDLVTVSPHATRRSAIEQMMKHHVRHLPVTGPDGGLLGMLSIRHLYRSRLRRLQGEMATLEAYICADGPGG